MTTTLPPDLKQFVQDELASGKFENESELMIRALQYYRELKSRHAALRAEVQASLAESARGESAPLDMNEIKAEVAKASAARRSAK